MNRLQATMALVFLCAACSAQADSAGSTPMEYINGDPPGTDCPEDGPQPAYAFFCDATGISGCMWDDNGTPQTAECRSPVAYVHHACACDILSRCVAYNATDDAGTWPVVECMKLSEMDGGQR